MILFIVAVVFLALLSGYVVGEVRGIRIGWDRATSEHDSQCPDEADSALRARQYTQEGRDELAALGGDR